jgi:hypothetical protein
MRGAVKEDCVTCRDRVIIQIRRLGRVSTVRYGKEFDWAFSLTDRVSPRQAARGFQRLAGQAPTSQPNPSAMRPD